MNGWAVLGILLLSLCLFGCAGKPPAEGSGTVSGVSGVGGEDTSVDGMDLVSEEDEFTMPSEPIYSEELGISSSDLSIEDLELDTSEDTFVLPDDFA